MGWRYGLFDTLDNLIRDTPIKVVNILTNESRSSIQGYQWDNTYDTVVAVLCFMSWMVYLIQWGLDLALFFVVCKEARYLRVEEGLKGFEKYTVKFNFGGGKDESEK